MNADIRRLLTEGANGDRRARRAFDVDGVVTRARRRRRVRRTVAIGLTTATVTTLVTGAVMARPDGGTRGGGVPAATSPDPGAAALSASEIIERCQPQLAELADYQQLADGTSFSDGTPLRWRLTWPDTVDRPGYRVGDSIALWNGNDGGNPTYCQIPAAGHADDPVSPEWYVPDPTDDAVVAQRCTALSGVDFTGWTVAAADETRDSLSVLMRSPDGTGYRGCNVMPFIWDAGGRVIVDSDGRLTDDAPFRLPSVMCQGPHGEPLPGCGSGPADDGVWPDAFNDGYRLDMDGALVGSDVKTAYVPFSGSIWRGEGVMSADAAELEFTLPSGRVVTRPVEDGRWAAAVYDPDTAAASSGGRLHVRVLAADDTVLDEYDVGYDLI